MVVLGKTGEIQSVLFSIIYQFLIRFFCVKPQDKMQSRALLGDGAAPGKRAFCNLGEEIIADGAVVIAHPVDMFFKVAVADKFC